MTKKKKIKFKVRSLIVGEQDLSPEDFIVKEGARDKIEDFMQMAVPKLRNFSAYDTSCLCGSIIATILAYFKYSEDMIKEFFKFHSESLQVLQEDILRGTVEKDE